MTRLQQIFPVRNTTNQGVKVRPAENIAKSVNTPRTGIFARLCGRVHSAGIGAPISSRSFRTYALAVLVVACSLTAMLCGVSSASAAGGPPAPGWRVFGRFAPTALHPGGDGVLHLYVYNTGAAMGAEGPTLVDRLPAGLEAVGSVSGSQGQEIEETPGCSGTTEVTCKLALPEPGGNYEEVEIPVRVAASASNDTDPVDLVSVSGGGALGPADARVPVVFGSKPAGLGFANFDAWLTNADGTVATQAGSHPYAITVAFALNSEGLGPGSEAPTVGEPQDLDVNLPPGLIGEPSAVPECTREQFDGEGCPSSSLIGEDHASISGVGNFKTLVYNMVPPPGIAAQFGFNFNGTSTFLDARVRSGGDDGITEQVDPTPERRIVFNSTTIWGVPAEHTESAAELERNPPKPLLTLPTSCGVPPAFSIETLSTWQEPGAFARAGAPWSNSEGAPVGITGCERLAHFTPSIGIAPDTAQADTPAGLSATVRVPQGLNPEGLATSSLQNTTVVLPEGIAINPGQATGLVACQPSEENVGGPDAEKEVEDGPPSCPAASKVGEDEIQTPLLPDRLKGSVYVLQSNPPNLQLLVAASGDGVNLKLVGTVHLNEATGQLVTTFENTPDAPFNEFKLAFSGGAQAALVTPPTCRVYRTNTEFTPWASPFIANELAEGNFTIDSGPGGSACTPYGSPLPFAPTLTAGSTTDQAGGYTDFSLLLQRGDGQQRFSSLSFKAPEGLSGMIAKVPLCGEQQANEGTCSSASQIGHAVVGAGPGPYPFYIPQQGAPPAAVYLTGPYQGAPFGLSIVTPVVAGPFNLGTNVVRARIEIDPHTAQITVTTDASGPHSIPTILDGIPTDVRSINTVIDRPGFMFNPTNCSPQVFAGTAHSAEGASAAISSHFQMGSCQSLKFAPNFKVSTAGKASKAQGASLTADIVYPTGALGANQASSQSNIASVKVDLPKQLPSRLTTLQKACTAAQFEANPAGCPAASVVGHAKVITPILPVPLEGPAFFVSHGGEAFPSLEVMLQGYGVTVELVGSTFISKAGITSSTFKSTPDVPFSSFELTLPRGKYSALTANVPAKANYSLCGQKLTMPTMFTAQDGAVIHQSTPISVTGCAKKKTAKKPKKQSKKSSRRNGGKGGK